MLPQSQSLAQSQGSATHGPAEPIYCPAKTDDSAINQNRPQIITPKKSFFIVFSLPIESFSSRPSISTIGAITGKIEKIGTIRFFCVVCLFFTPEGTGPICAKHPSALQSNIGATALRATHDWPNGFDALVRWCVFLIDKLDATVQALPLVCLIFCGSPATLGTHHWNYWHDRWPF